MIFKLHHRALMAAFAVGMMGVGVTSCSENIDSADTNNGEGPIAAVDVVDAQAQALQAYKANPNTQTYADLLSAQGLKETDLVHRTLPAKGAMANGLMFVESSVPTVAAEEVADTRGRLAAGITDDFTITAYRAAAAAGVGSADIWIPGITFDKNGNPKKPFRWGSKKPYARFYAVFPVASAATGVTVNAENAKVPTVTFTANTNNQAQKDLMVATSPVVKYEGGNTAPKVTLPFRHALTAINFAIGEKLAPGKHITKVTISRAFQKGVYNMGSDEKGTGAGWSAQSNEAIFTLDGISVPTDGTVGNIILGDVNNSTFLMVPQVLTGRNVELRVEFDNNPNDFISTTLTGEWKAGETRTYKLSNKDDNWQYTFSVQMKASTDVYALNGDIPFTVQSYRAYNGQAGTQQAVSWNVEKYEVENADGTWTNLGATPPTWLNVTKKLGNGGFDAESSTAVVKSTAADMEDVLAQYNAALRTEHNNNGAYRLGLDGTSLSTANTYAIVRSGKYTLPLVYGSSFVKSQQQSSVYTGFKDYLGNAITAPWVIKGNTPVARNGSTQYKAKVIWSNPEGAVKFDTNQARNFTNGKAGEPAWLNFTIDKTKVKCGNAVIAVTDAQNRVMWSWQLWFTHEGATASVPVKGKAQNAKTYKYMAEPLGWVYTKLQYLKGAKDNTRRVKVTLRQASSNKGSYFIITQKYVDGDGYNMVYQWGRKDPFPGVDFGQGIKLMPAPSDYKSLIQNPDLFYTVKTRDTHAAYWTNDENRNKYWDANYSDNANRVIQKTLFDPSPAGYRVPEIQATYFILDKPQEGIYLNDKPTNIVRQGSRIMVYCKTNINNGLLFIPYFFGRNFDGHMYYGADAQNQQEHKVNAGNYWTLTASQNRPRVTSGVYSFLGGIGLVGNAPKEANRTPNRHNGLSVRPVVDPKY